jgi:hypothetical protein
MKIAKCGPVIVVLVAVTASIAHADENSATPGAVRSAIEKSLPLLEKAARGSMEERSQCFTCHSQGLPIIALTAARSRGFKIDDEHLKTQLEFTAEFLARNKTKYLEGKGQGGQVDTAGYALFALDSGGWKPDETTAAVTEYFLLYQNGNDHWRSGARRPPTEQSPFTASYLALRGLKAFGTSEQRQRIDRRFEQLREWLVQTSPQDTEDRVFRLRALPVVGASTEETRSAAQDLLQMQRSDGGWAQLATMESDPYATGSALVALHQAGGLPATDAAYRRGANYLVSTQQADGSWHVVTRSRPFQTYYETGYPHGADQFISTAAAGWATTALVLTLPPGVVETPPSRPTE